MRNIIRRKINTLYNLLFNKPIGMVYMLHRVDSFDKSKLFPNENMKVTTDFLEEVILSLKETHEFISLDDLKAILDGTRRRLKKPFVVITLDDGYKDNFLNAFPIFQKYDIPFTVYIATSFPEKNALMWWYILEDIILKNDRVVLNSGEVFDCATPAQKVEVFMILRKKILDLPYTGFNQSFIQMFGNYNFDNDSFVREMSLDWDQIVEMSKSPLCTIGAHTVTHCRLSVLTPQEMQAEIKESKRLIENYTGIYVKHFSYPFGTDNEVDEIVIDMLSQSEFTTATIAGGGEIRKHGNNLYAIKRIMLTQN